MVNSYEGAGTDSRTGSDRAKSVELVYGGAAAADQPTESDVGDIVARSWAALEGIESEGGRSEHC